MTQKSENGYGTLADECENQCRVLKERREEREWQERKEKYDRLIQEKNKASTEKDWWNLGNEFHSMKEYGNAAELAVQCYTRARTLRKEQREGKQPQSKHWEQQGLCRHCGGQMGGIFTKKCKSCGRAKD